MLRRNVGRLDQMLRLLVGLLLIPVGLFALRGAEGSVTGIVVTAFAVIPILTGLTRFCPAYLPFGVSTDRGGNDVAESLEK